MKLIHRHYEALSDSGGFLHNVEYNVDDNDMALCLSFQTHIVRDGIVNECVISHDTPLNQITAFASYTILLADGMIDQSGKMIE